MTENKRDIHIGIIRYKNCPKEIITDTIDDLKTDGLSIEVQEYIPSPFAAMEWIIPTAIAAYIGKPYFDGFLKEAGQDHYQILKNWFKKLANNTRALKVFTITSSGSEDKITDGYSQSKAISLLIQTKSDRTVKLLLDRNLTKEDWDDAIDQLFDYVMENYENLPNDRLTERIIGLKQDKRFHIYGIIDKETKQLMFYDDNGLFQLQQQK